MQLVVVAGGKGTRLKDRLGDLPKSDGVIGGKPLLEHLVLLAARHNIKDILILSGYGASFIEDYFRGGEQWGVHIRYRREEQPLGTAGAVLNAFDDLDGAFLLMYGDTMMNVNLERFAASHPPEAAASLFVHPNDHPQDSDLVEIAPSGRVRAFHPYPHSEGEFFSNLVNAALYLIRKDSLQPFVPELVSLNRPLDFGKHVFPALLKQGAWLQAYVSREYIKDAGTPERLDQVEEHFHSGRIGHGSIRHTGTGDLSRPRRNVKRRARFFDLARGARATAGSGFGSACHQSIRPTCRLDYQSAGDRPRRLHTRRIAANSQQTRMAAGPIACISRRNLLLPPSSRQRFPGRTSRA